MSTATESVTSLARWANGKEDWVRSIAQRVISERRQMSVREIQDSYNQLLAEKGLSDKRSKKAPKIKTGSTVPSAKQFLRLKSLKDVSGVNRLSESQTIEFNERLTVIYGENATGKSGYSRILKSAANSRGSAPVLGNVYEVSATSPAAKIAFDLSSELQEAEWSGHPIEELEGICVFDAPTAPMHVDENLEYQYVPADLELFEYVHAAIKSVQALLDEEQKRRRPQPDVFQNRFSEGTRVSLALTKLNGLSDLKQIRDLAQQSREGDFNISELRNRVAVLTGDRDGTKSLGIKTKRDKCNKALAACAALLAFDGDKYGDLVTAIEVARQEVTAMSSVLFEGFDIPGFRTTEWEDFVAKAHTYSINHVGDSPSKYTICPYCHQELTETGKKLLQKYYQHISDDSQTRLANLGEQRTNLSNNILAIDPSNEEIDDDMSEEPWFISSERISNTLAIERSKLELGAEWNLDVETLKQDEAVLKKEVNKLTIELANETTDVEERATQLAIAKGELLEAEDRTTLVEILPTVEKYAADIEWVNQAAEILDQFPGIFRSLTEKAKDTSRRILNSNFEEAFRKECSLLRCPIVQLQFPGRKGTTLRQKSVGNSDELSEVLSEGEQKVVALADFLAEISLRSTSAPIIFDDPITSLDARRNDEVASRIISLSQEHQVIVFTHHLYFASKLIAAFDGSELRQYCSFYEVLAEDKHVGLVHRGKHPRSDSVAAVRKRVNATLQEAASLGGRDRDDMIATAYGHIRTWIESFVEDELLQSTVKRHRANISIDALSRIDSSRLDEALEIIGPIFDRACRRMWPHSQPDDALNSRPRLDEVQSDWDSLCSL